MKYTLIVIMTLLSLNAFAQDVKYYDRQGKYIGKVTESGKIYDRKGVYVGKQDVRQAKGNKK